MAHTSSSCQYIPADTQKLDVSAIHGNNLIATFTGKQEVTAIDNVSFDIENHKITAIIGESGSGKSTLLKLIYGLIEPNAGEVRYKGWLVPTRKDKLIPGHDAMKMVSQGFDDLNLYAKVWDNIASQLPNTNLEYKQSQTAATLKKLRIDHLAQHRVADLSGGERQRVAIARALINNPEVLLMDEPFNQVDAAFRDGLQQDIKQIVQDTGLTVVLVSHDPAEVLAMADALIVMQQGKIVDSGNPKDLYYQPKHPYTALLLAKSNIITAQQAEILQLPTTSSGQIAIHQEWIDVTKNQQSPFRIKDIKFRGFYSEYVIGNQEINLHAIIKTKTPVSIGTGVDIQIQEFISFQVQP